MGIGSKSAGNAALRRPAGGCPATAARLLTLAFVFLCTLCPAGPMASDGSIGNFDIEKVRKAVQTGDTLGETAAASGERDSLAAVAVRVTLYLAVVIVLIVGIAWFFRKNGLGSVRGGGSGSMDLIETLALGQNRIITMVRVMDEVYLLAHTSSSVTVIDKIGGQRALDVIAASRNGGAIVQFKDAFNAFMGKMKKPA